MLRRAVPFVLVVLLLTVGTAYAAAPNDPGWSAQWHLRTIHADAAWARTKGSGIVVAIVDTGVDLSHPDLRGRLVTGKDFVDPGTPPDDEQGHGTFMAGLVAADTGNGEGVASVAPLAKIMPVRVLDAQGSGKPSVVSQGIDWAVSHGADVINLSLAVESTGGSGGSSGENLYGDTGLTSAINRASDAGRVVVVAAGNNFSSGGSAQTSYKAQRSGVIVVGASTSRDRRAAYSNYGDGLDVLAPGGGSSSTASASSCLSNAPVVSTWWNPVTGESIYGRGCGTSMAVAHVSGTAALLMAKGYSNSGAVSRIERTAKDIYSAGFDAESGWGRVDAAAAVGATSSTSSHPKSKPKTSSRPRAPRSKVGVAGTKPTVKGTKIAPPAAATTPGAPLAGVRLSSAGPYAQPDDPRLRLFALALALSVGVAVANTLARRSSER